MATTSPVLGLPVPEGTDPTDVPADLDRLATRLDAVPGIESLTTAQRDALAAAQRPTGRVIYNTTSARFEYWNGTAWAALAATTAAAISYAGSTNLAATNVEAALDELDAEKAATGHTHADPTKTVRVPHTWAIAGEIKVASGDTDYIPPFFVSVPAGQTVRAVACRSIIKSGTSVTFTIQRRDSGGFVTTLTGLGGGSASPTAATLDFTDANLADNDQIELTVDAVSGVPKNLSVTLWLEYVV